ncbi:hypothetical protein HJ588_12320 [Flexivirga sp. ID2601S]|uniref:Uncharacterized protein n=1 Tax=Flexivirga aerilata TaxID=1656889 RepID=A0A849AJN5_9MICO|nr:hypothetical protein [Flexivirga aerilata]NNG40047.1 hypothetical protein [Flexivirga aerilata]
MFKTSIVGTALIAFALTGCGSDQRPVGKTTQELQVIRSSTNGLYFSPHLLTERASIGENVAGVSTAPLVGAPTRLTPAEPMQRKLRTEAFAAYGTNAYGQLAVLYAAGADKILSKADLPALQRLRLPDGSYRSPDGTSLAARVNATGLALFATKTLGGLDASQSAQSTAWLAGIARTESDQSTVFAALKAIRRVDPSRAPAYTGPVPNLATLAAQQPQARATTLQLAAAYVDAVGTATASRHLDKAGACGLYTTNVATSDLPTMQVLVTVMRGSGYATSDVLEARRRLDASRLPDGLYRNTGELAGSAIASVYAMRLMRMRGDNPTDPRLAQSLLTYSKLPEVASRPPELLIALGGSVIAGNKKARAGAKKLCDDQSVVPRTVTATNAVGWSELSRICFEAGSSGPTPSFQQWPAATPEQAVSQAAVVNTLAAAGRRASIPSWISAGAFQKSLDARSTLSLDQRTMLATALLTLTKGDGRENFDSLRVMAQDSRGCRGLPDLYRDNSEPPSCDLRTTVSVEQFLSA